MAKKKKINHPPFRVVAKSKNKVGYLLITGYINSYGDNSGAKIKKAVQELDEDHDFIVVEMVNCYGGSVYEGMVGYEAIRDCNANTHCTVEGLVASMGSVFPLACDTKEITRLSRGMLHRPEGGVAGDFEKVKEYSEELERIQGEMAEIYAEASGKSVKWVQENWMARGVDKFLTSADMVKNFGFEESKRKDKIKDDPADVSDPETLSMEEMGGRYSEAYAAFDQEDFEEPEGRGEEPDTYQEYLEKLKSQKQTNSISMEKLVEMALALGMSADSPEADVLAEMKKVQTAKATAEAKVLELKATIDGQHEVDVKAYLDSAKEQNKITKAQVEIYEPMAATPEGFAGVKKLIDAIKPHESASSKISDEKKKDDSRADWKWEDFHQKDSKALAKMQKEDPDRYNGLFEEWKESRKE